MTLSGPSGASTSAFWVTISTLSALCSWSLAIHPQIYRPNRKPASLSLTLILASASTSFFIGYSNLIWQSVALNYGRRPVLLLSFLLVIIQALWQAWCTKSMNLSCMSTTCGFPTDLGVNADWKDEGVVLSVTERELIPPEFLQSPGVDITMARSIE